jgi:hypothetical protein
MMSSSSPSASTGEKGQSNRIAVALAEQGGKSIFKLTFRGETIPLLESASLNRWAALGIIDRHKISIMSDGVTIDGRHLLYSDPQAPAELERMVNRPETTMAHAPAATTARPAATAAVSEQGSFDAVAFADHVRVTRDGFEFHVLYRTRFGQNKTERLDAALEAFQNMRVFKPHVNIQKTGIRLVVTRWDGESFVEEPGIENLEHATPEEVENLIKANLQGGTSPGPTEMRGGRKNRPRQVVRVEVVRKPHDARFHLLLHRLDGTTEEGPALVRANIAKLVAEGLFRPDVSVSMTAMSDGVVIARKQTVGGQTVVQNESYPLGSEKDAKAVELALNECLRPVPEEAPEVVVTKPVVAAPESPVAVAVPPAPAPVVLERAPSPAPAPPPPAPPPAPPRVIGSSSGETAPTVVGTPRPVVESIPVQPPAPPLAEKPAVPAWLTRCLREVKALPAEQINAEVFHALHRRFERLVQTNEHDFPAFTLEVGGKDGNLIGLELVLGTHYLLVTFPFGYLRFGAETRLFLNRLDDYIAFAGHALRGVLERNRSLGFLVTREFVDFLRAQTDRNYKGQFGDFLIVVEEVKANDALLWPLVSEERLFEAVAATAVGYGLPVTRDAVVLDPSAPVFLGFKRVSPHGMEFRDDADYVRFTPDDVQLNEGGQFLRFEASDVLRGWALDAEGRVCALYRTGTDFVPPAETKLLRFLAEDQAERENLTLLARLPADEPPPT